MASNPYTQNKMCDKVKLKDQPGFSATNLYNQVARIGAVIHKKAAQIPANNASIASPIVSLQLVSCSPTDNCSVGASVDI